MAITKIIGPIHKPSKGGKYKILRNTINYIENPEKTENGRYVGTHNCIPGYALKQMQENIRKYRKEPVTVHDRIGYHFTISWPPDCDISPEIAMEITEQFCKEVLADYQAVYAVHTDTKHIHSHICFSAVSLDGKKYHYQANDWERILQPTTDRLCQAYGFHTLDMDIELEEMEKEERRKQNAARWKYRRTRYQEMEPEAQDKKRKSNTDYYKEEGMAYSLADHIRCDIDDAVYRSKRYEDFIAIMRSKGYQIKQGKYLAVKTKDMQRFRRIYKLGMGYSEADIRDRIALGETADVDVLQQLLLEPEPEKDYRRIRLTKESRRHYARQYQAGLLKPGQNRSYRVIRASLKRLEQMQEVSEYLILHDINSQADAQSRLDVLQQAKEQIKEKKRGYLLRLAPYRELISDYKKIQEAQTGYEYYKETGDEVFREEYESYERYEEWMQSCSIDLDTLGKIYEKHRGLMKNFYKENQKIQKEEAIIRQYLDDTRSISLDEQQKEAQVPEREKGKEDENYRRQQYDRL